MERCGAIVSRSLYVTAGQGHEHSGELARWDQAYQGSSGTGEDPVAALRDLIAAAVRAAVLAPETELRRWFSWQRYWTDSLVDDPIGRGRLRRIDVHVTVARAGHAKRRRALRHPGILPEVTNSDFKATKNRPTVSPDHARELLRRAERAGLCVS